MSTATLNRPTDISFTSAPVKVWDEISGALNPNGPVLGYNVMLYFDGATSFKYSEVRDRWVAAGLDEGSFPKKRNESDAWRLATTERNKTTVATPQGLAVIELPLWEDSAFPIKHVTVRQIDKAQGVFSYVSPVGLLWYHPQNGWGQDNRVGEDWLDIVFAMAKARYDDLVDEVDGKSIHRAVSRAIAGTFPLHFTPGAHLVWSKDYGLIESLMTLLAAIDPDGVFGRMHVLPVIDLKSTRQELAKALEHNVAEQVNSSLARIAQMQQDADKLSPTQAKAEFKNYARLVSTVEQYRERVTRESGQVSELLKVLERAHMRLMDAAIAAEAKKKAQ